MAVEVEVEDIQMQEMVELEVLVEEVLEHLMEQLMLQMQQ
jgi:hypothetical protein